MFGDGQVPTMDCWKKCRVGLACQRFWFIQRVVESNLVVGEGIYTCHHMFQSKNYKNSCVGSSDFHNKKIVVEMFNLLEIDITKLPAKPTKEKERGKEVAIYWKIAPPKALVDREEWKVSLLKGIYVIRLLTLIQIIWLKGS